MTTAADNVIPLTGNPLIDGLTWGAAWQFGSGAHVLTYSLSLNDNPNGGAWGQAQADAVRYALGAWSNVANLSFVESGSGGVYLGSPADLAFVLTGNELQSQMAGLIALGLPPSPSFANTFLASNGATRSIYPQPEGDIALDNYYSGASNLSPGGAALWVILHEIGHALGLKHTDNGPDGRPTFASLGVSSLDSGLYTVMSYNGPSGGAVLASQSAGNASTPMPLDVLAIQQIYGANTSYHSGNDTYDIATSFVSAFTIWDVGGNDTLALSLSGANAGTIDLREGHYSSQSGFAAGLPQAAIAYGVTIENARGGNGSDSLIGNDAANTFEANAGNDTISGGFGNDTLIGGAGNDNLNGGFGLDVAVFSGPIVGYSITKSGSVYTVTDINSANGDDGIDTLTGIERFQFSDAEVGMAVESGMRIGHVDYPASWLAYYTVADFNADGRTDISWVTRSGLAGTWTIDGANTWNASAMRSPFTGWSTVDNNGDGKADAAFQHTAAGGMIQWNALSLAEQLIPAAPSAPEMPTAPPTTPPVTPPPPPVTPPMPPAPLIADWVM